MAAHAATMPHSPVRCETSSAPVFSIMSHSAANWRGVVAGGARNDSRTNRPAARSDAKASEEALSSSSDAPRLSTSCEPPSTPAIEAACACE